MGQAGCCSSDEAAASRSTPTPSSTATMYLSYSSCAIPSFLKAAVAVSRRLNTFMFGDAGTADHFAPSRLKR